MQSFEDLEVWRRSFRLIAPTYRLTAGFPSAEKFGLIAQMRDAVVSAPANIAEGSGRRTPGEFRNHLSIASGSASELECLFLVSIELEFATASEVRPFLNEIRAIRRMIAGFDQTLTRRYAKPQRKPVRPLGPARPKRPGRPPDD